MVRLWNYSEDRAAGELDLSGHEDGSFVACITELSAVGSGSRKVETSRRQAQGCQGWVHDRRLALREELQAQ